MRVGVRDANRPVASVVQPTSYTTSTYYTPAPQVVYREPVRIYSPPPPVVIYGGWNSGYGRGYEHKGYGHDRHRW